MERHESSINKMCFRRDLNFIWWIGVGIWELLLGMIIFQIISKHYSVKIAKSITALCNSTDAIAPKKNYIRHIKKEINWLILIQHILSFLSIYRYIQARSQKLAACFYAIILLWVVLKRKDLKTAWKYLSNEHKNFMILSRNNWENCNSR